MDASSAGDQESALLAALLGGAMDAVAVFDHSGDLVAVNDRLAQLHGTDAAELEGSSLDRVLATPSARRVTDEILADLAIGDVWEGPLAGHRADGSPLALETTVTALPDGRGVLVARRRDRRTDPGVPSPADVDRLDVVVRHAPVVLFELASDGTFTLSRGRALRKLGLEPDEVVGETVFDVYADHQGILDVARRALGGESLTSTAEVDGRVFQTRWTPVMDEGGAVQRVIGVATDVTERRRQREVLVDRQHQLDTIIDSAPVTLFSIGPEGRLQFAEGQAIELLGLDQEDLIGRPVTEIAEDPERSRRHLERLAGGETIRDVVDFRDRVLEIYMEPIHDDEELVQVIGTAVDVTERERAHAERRASEQLFRGVFEASNDPIILHDLDGWIEEVNERALEMLGYEREDLVGSHVLELQPEDSMEPGQEALEQVMAEGSAQVETVMETVDGERIPVEVSARRFEVGDRELVQGIARDISEQKKVEEHLRGLVRELEAAEGELRSLVNAMPDLLLVLDDQGRYVEAPRGNLELLPADPDEIVGRHLSEILPEEIADRLQDAAQRALSEDGIVRVEHSLPIDDEARFLEGRLVSVPGRQVLLLARDITDLKRAQEEIKSAQEQFELAVGELSRSLGAARGNEAIAERLAKGAQSIVGARAAVALAPEGVLAIASAPREDADEIEALARSDPQRFAWFSASLDDSDRPIDLLILPREDRELEDPDRQKLEIIATQAAIAFHRAEITDRVRRAHDRLERSARQKQMFLDVLSHDLKNPLAVALGRVDLIEKRRPEISEELETIKSSLERADRLIDRSLLFSRLEEQEGLSRSREDLRDLAERVCKDLGGAMEEADVDVAVEGAADVKIQAHPILEQAVENLVSNALKWSPRGSSVELWVDTDGEHALLKVVDHGPGIPVEERSKLFDRFTRVDRSGTKGTGLGLAIADRIVGMHDGRLWHEETPGGGATFALELPLAE